MIETTYKTVELDNKEYVIIPKNEFMELLEDLEDIKLIDEAKATSTKKYTLDEANDILDKYDNNKLTDEDIDNL